MEEIELNQHILPYPKHITSPKIEPVDLTHFKQMGVDKVNKVFKNRYENLLKLAKTIEESFLINREVYDSKYSFEPNINEIYHLYEDNDGNRFLSIISPSEWNKNYLYSVKLNYEMVWEKQNHNFNNKF